MGFKTERTRAGISASEAAKRLNVSRMTLWSWESGEFFPRSDKLLEIARLYECSVEDLLRNNHSKDTVQ